MRSWRQLGTAWLTLFILLAGCAPSQPSAPASQAETRGGAQPATAPSPKRITIGISGDPNTLNNSIGRAGSGGVPGVDALEELVNAGLTLVDDTGALQPQLAEAVPSIENGLWKVFPDGRMDTTWKLRPNARWHDGTPVTSNDLLFTVQVGQDKDLPALGNAGYSSLDSVEAVDASTVTAHWKQPFVQADTLFTFAFAVPLPRHLLERAYTEDKTNFTQHPYFTIEFVGTGAYRLQTWVQSSHLIVAANDGYVLGRPKIDEIQVKFIPDPNALIANILAGEVELTMGRGLSLEQAIQVRDQWRDGRLGVVLSSWIAAYPQMLNPTPSVVADARFRRALLHAVDRQQIVDVLQAGQSAVAHSYVSPKEADYRAIESSIVRYDYDPRRAMELIESLGYTRGADSGFRDAAGQPLSVEIRTTGGDDLQEKTMFSIADYWQRAGIAVDPVVVPRQRATDREYRANFPAFEEVRQPNDVTPSALTRMHGSEASLPENSYRGSNRMRYRNAELDGLIDRFYVTIPKGERTLVLGQIMHHMTDQVIPLGMFYNTQPTMIANRLQNVTPGGSGATPAWNSYAWDLR
jgi:peptide/nickel transport system substrate-binding protein